MSQSRAIAIANGIGLVGSALVLASGIIWYPLIEVAIVAPLALLFVVVTGIWLGAIWPAPLAFGVGNAAVIAGYAGLLAPYGLTQYASSINPIFVFGVALMFVVGYALVAGSLARGLLAKGSRL